MVRILATEVPAPAISEVVKDRIYKRDDVAQQKAFAEALQTYETLTGRGTTDTIAGDKIALICAACGADGVTTPALKFFVVTSVRTVMVCEECYNGFYKIKTLK